MKKVTIAALIILSFLIGYTIGSLHGEKDRQSISVLRIHQEMLKAIEEGKPFYLQGSTIKIFPITNKSVKAKGE